MTDEVKDGGAAKEPDPVWIVFTRNWHDNEGVGHGFRWVSTTGAASVAISKVSDLNNHQVAGATKWETARLSPELVMQQADALLSARKED